MKNPIIESHISNYPHISQPLEYCKFDSDAPLWARLAVVHSMKLFCNAYLIKADIDHMTWESQKKESKLSLKTYGVGETYPVNLSNVTGKYKTFFIPGSYNRVTGSNRLIKVPLDEIDAYYVKGESIIIYPKRDAAFYYRSWGQCPKYLGTNPYKEMPSQGIPFFKQGIETQYPHPIVGEAVSKGGTRLDAFYPHTKRLKKIEMNFSVHFPDCPELAVEWALQKEVISKKLFARA